jgi:probable F420-dependent oxidoreductase
MRVHAIVEGNANQVAERAALAEALGFDGVSTTETVHDPFVSLALAAARTERVELGTAIAAAFPRSPWTLAQLANDLHELSQGRFVLGLGSQVRAHVERRFSAAFDRPAARMRELIQAVRAIWAAWAGEAELRFEGEFYRHSLVGPMFDPGPNPFGNPAILVAAVGARMTEVAGEVADGVIVHGFSTPRYLRDATLPSLAKGLARGRRDPDAVEVCRPVFLVTGVDDVEVAAADARVRGRLAFYGATAAYRPVLAMHGWEALHDELLALSRQGRTAEMAALIDDELLAEFAVVADLDALPAAIEARYGGLVDRLSFNVDLARDPDRWAAVVDGLHAVPGRRAAATTGS